MANILNVENEKNKTEEFSNKRRGEKEMHKKYVSAIIVSLLLVGTFAGLNAIQPVKAAISDIHHAGCRASTYGISPFPTPAGWENAIKTMAGFWPGSQPIGIWIVGILAGEGSDYWSWTDCNLQFPSPGGSYPYIRFNDTDFHEQFLAYFDTHGIKVFLQVEPGLADIPTLIDLVLNRYGSHSCVIGFGIDVEWYKSSIQKFGIEVTDAEAQAWEAAVKAHNSSYKLFLKHWWWTWMPPTYRGDLIFIDDSQGLGNLDRMVKEYRDQWAAHLGGQGNILMFQVGYEKDRTWWSKLPNPPKDIGDAIASAINGNPLGIIWVDFTLREVLPTEPPPPPGVMHVASIDMSGTKTGPKWKAYATVKIVDNNNAPVPSATVYGHWSGAWTGDVNGVTGSDGKIKLSSGSVTGGGTFTFTVTNVVKTDWTYDPAQNVETSDTITLP